MIHLCGPRNPHKDAINTTSRSTNWSKGLNILLNENKAKLIQT
jgi:hypothetical protein